MDWMITQFPAVSNMILKDSAPFLNVLLPTWRSFSPQDTPRYMKCPVKIIGHDNTLAFSHRRILTVLDIDMPMRQMRRPWKNIRCPMEKCGFVIVIRWSVWSGTSKRFQYHLSSQNLYRKSRNSETLQVRSELNGENRDSSYPCDMNNWTWL